MKKTLFALMFAILMIFSSHAGARSHDFFDCSWLFDFASVRADIYALDSDSRLRVWRGGGFRKGAKIAGVDGQVIGIDFRPADQRLYALTDLGSLYVVDTEPPNFGSATLVSTLSTRFAGGVQSLMDFNPVVNAIRLIGSNDQNFAIVSSGGDLNLTVQQTRLAYALGDVNEGVDPNICGGAYTNNRAGAANTIFFALDYDLDTLVTIAPPLTANGSSNTGGGRLQTLGRLVTESGDPFNLSPTSDLDIYTADDGTNYLVGVSGRSLFTIDLSQFAVFPALGQAQDVLVRFVTIGKGGLIDVAVAPR